MGSPYTREHLQNASRCFGRSRAAALAKKNALLSLRCGMNKTQWLFRSGVQAQASSGGRGKPLIAMINDKRLEERGDTAATSIILSHQSLLLCPSSSSKAL